MPNPQMTQKLDLLPPVEALEFATVFPDGLVDQEYDSPTPLIQEFDSLPR
jgi:hypothetical protein